MTITGYLEAVFDDNRVRVRGHASWYPVTYPVTEEVASKAKQYLHQQITLECDAWGVGVKIAPAKA